MATAFSPQERERIRDSLLDAALKSAATQGMRHATVDGLAREAGISKGAFYRFYPSKEHLFLSMLERTLRKCTAARKRCWTSGPIFPCGSAPCGPFWRYSA